MQFSPFASAKGSEVQSERERGSAGPIRAPQGPFAPRTVHAPSGRGTLSAHIASMNLGLLCALQESVPPEAHSCPGKFRAFHGHSIHWGVLALHSLSLHLELPHTALGLCAHGKALCTPMFCGWSVFCGVSAPQSCSVHPRVHPCTRDSVYPTDPLCIAGSQHPKACPRTRSHSMNRRVRLCSGRARGCSMLWGVPRPQNCSMHPSHGPSVHRGTVHMLRPLCALGSPGTPEPLCVCWGIRASRSLSMHRETPYTLLALRVLGGPGTPEPVPAIQSRSVHWKDPCTPWPLCALWSWHSRVAPCNGGPRAAPGHFVHSEPQHPRG